MMNVLHICDLDNNKANGISNVVPEHFMNQQKYANVAILNCNDTIIEKLVGQKSVYNINDIKDYDISSLPVPFNKPDIVIFHGIYSKKYLSISKILRKNHISYIIVAHGSLTNAAQRIRFVKKFFANILLFDKFIYNAKRIQYLSLDEQNMSNSFKCNSFVCGNGMKSEDYFYRNIDKNHIKLLYIGRYSIKHKGLDLLMKSCQSCKTFMEENNVILEMYGKDDKMNNGTKYLNDFIKEHQMEQIIKIYGPVYNEEKQEKLKKSDFFIQTSRLEGQPLGIMEAMMYGLPIIVSKGTTFGNIAIENETGFCCSTVDEISDTIKNLPNCLEDYLKMSKNSYDYAKENFSWDKIAKLTIDNYEKIIMNNK